MPSSFRDLFAGPVTVGVIGLGYVGLPLVHVFWRSGLRVIGFDIDPAKVEALNAGRSYIQHFAPELVAEMAGSGRFSATVNFDRLGEADAILICVPTPLGPTREPDLRYVEDTAHAIAKRLRPGQLVILESTTYPGTTDEVVRPVLAATGLKIGSDVLLAFSPEREDPGGSMETRAIPKVVGGVDPLSGEIATALYARAFDQAIEVKDARTAEAVKITENIFRAVNIALVNELKTIFGAMDIDVWDVIEAAKTKPFGYMPFYPGPGLGGHCIPIDPFYLSWRARAFDMDARFIELAGEVNRAMPRLVVQALSDALNARFGRAMRGARILVMGVAYKKNVDDLRESPSLRLIDLMEAMGAAVDFHDPHIPVIHTQREHARLDGRERVCFDRATVQAYDAALIATDHQAVDYAALVAWSKLVVDTRNATRGVAEGRDKIVRA
jgi:UDP-N-acetyl-D-glucosamine dehydrogenase